ncbi:MAG: (2Fe-2S)-binding protein [Sphingomonas sp.]
MPIEFNVNGRRVRFAGDGDTPLLWALREDLGLRGTKFGCGKGLCGACTVHLDDTAVRSCSIPVSAVKGARVRTIEGLGSAAALHPVQQAWLEIDVPQCGFCQSGQIMAAASLLRSNPEASDQDIGDAMTNLCRCGTYRKIRAAIHRAQALIATGTATKA